MKGMFFMYEKYMDNVLEKFHLITHIPILTVDYNGKILKKVGYNRQYEHLFEDYNIYHTIVIERDKEENFIATTVSCVNGVYFTATPVCPKNKYRGLFVIGPYSNKKDNLHNLVYKPLDLVPDLVRIIRVIWKGYSKKRFMFSHRSVSNLHIRKAIDYLDARYMDNISLDDVAQYLNINKSYLSSLFKKETGKTFTQYLNNIRIERSKELLLEDKNSVLDVALAVGFSNQNYYNIMFKRLTGLTPLEYRNKNS